MAKRPDRAQRKAMRDAFKQREREAAEARLPLSKEHLAQLFDYLDERLSEDTCDHTLRLSELFLAERGLDIVRVTEWLRESGGYCDCEVLANVESVWQDWL